MDELIKNGKFLSLILRHKPEVIGISLDEHGWANVFELITGIKKNRNFDMNMLEEIVRTDMQSAGMTGVVPAQGITDVYNYLFRIP